MREAAFITSEVQKLENTPYVVLGDFNAMSPMDADLNAQRPKLLERYRQGDSRQEKYANLRDKEFDYSVISRFLGLPAIDVCQRFMPLDERYSFPAPVLVGSYYEDATHIQRTHQRIDFILTSPDLARKCTSATVAHDEVVQRLSDHYPVIATFERP